MLKKLPLNDLKWMKDISEFGKSFIKCYKDKGCFLKVDIRYQESLHNLDNDLPFLPERTKISKISKIYMIKLNMLLIQEI